MVNKPKAAPAPVKAAPVKAAPKPVAARPVSSSFGGDGQGIFTGEGFAGTGRFQYREFFPNQPKPSGAQGPCIGMHWLGRGDGCSCG
jgi:hypothetical protein